MNLVTAKSGSNPNRKWVIAMFDETKYKADFARENYDRVGFTVPKGKRTDIKRCASQRGVSITQLIVYALEQTYNLDLSK